MTELLQLTLRATLASALHIAGPGRTVALVDRPILLDTEGFPMIPASTVRGRLRAHLERLLRATGEPVCTPPTPDRMCPHHAWNGQAPAGGYCLACRIFGSSWHASRLTVADLTLAPNQRAAADLQRPDGHPGPDGHPDLRRGRPAGPLAGLRHLHGHPEKARLGRRLSVSF